jgi:hypothetical protein
VGQKSVAEWSASRKRQYINSDFAFILVFSPTGCRRFGQWIRQTGARMTRYNESVPKSWLPPASRAWAILLLSKHVPSVGYRAVSRDMILNTGENLSRRRYTTSASSLCGTDVIMPLPVRSRKSSIITSGGWFSHNATGPLLVTGSVRQRLRGKLKPGDHYELLLVTPLSLRQVRRF